MDNLHVADWFSQTVHACILCPTYGMTRYHAFRINLDLLTSATGWLEPKLPYPRLCWIRPCHWKYGC